MYEAITPLRLRKSSSAYEAITPLRLQHMRNLLELEKFKEREF